MVTVARFCTRYWNYIRVAILLYLVCIVFTLAWLGRNKQQSLLWISSENGRPKVINTSTTQNNHPVRRVEILKVVRPRDPLSDKFVTYTLNHSKTFCGGDFVAYEKTLAKLSNVLIDPKYGVGRIGGENISEVFKQQEDKEYYKFSKGYFNLKCSESIQHSFMAKSHLNNWLSVLKTEDSLPKASASISTWTMAVMRYEYANLYHTMTDYYNAFIATKIFDLDPTETDVLWFDGHPWGALDLTWDVLFGKVSRIGQIKEATHYDNLVWNAMGYDSVLNNHQLPHIPFTEEFRDFFLYRHGISTETTLNCQKLKVLFLWRRDYLAHPRNPTGHVSRKIKNEDELLARAKELLPGHVIAGIQIDNLTMTRQLSVIANTDILIGMHGAGLTHTLFLPKHGGLVELYPTYWSSSNRHFRSMCQWRGLHYVTWTNREQTRELPDHYTMVDVDAVMKMLHEMHHKICGKDADRL